MDRSQLAYWESRAVSWSIAPPLSPSREDIAWYEAQAKTRADELAGSGMRVLLLGVTPAIAAMRWPAGTTTLVGVDWAEGMVRRWPADEAPSDSRVVRADWRELPLATGSIDLAVGDGCSGVMPSAADTTIFFSEVRRVLRADSVYCERCFCRPRHGRSVSALFEDLLSGQLRDLDFFRLLLAMTLQGDSRDGVSLRRVWQEWNEHVPDPAALKKRSGWTDQAIRNFETWRQSDGRYSYPSEDGLMQLAAPFFEIADRDLPGYETRDYFPRFVMRARAAPPKRAPG